MNTKQLEIRNLQKKWQNCLACQIGLWSFRHVFGEGSFDAQYVFVGEGPGVSEDVMGEPFVGASGRLLRKALDKAKFTYEEIYITNLVACRPCDDKTGPNRAPSDIEIIRCSKRLESIIRIIRPKLLVAVGNVAGDWLSEFFSSYRMKTIYHPSYILRNGGEKGTLYKDWLLTIKNLRRLKLED